MALIFRTASSSSICTKTWNLRYAARSLVRQATFTAVALLTLVLGIGANTAIFSVIKAVLLNQLPYRDPGRLVVLTEQNPDGHPDLVAPLTYADWKEQSRTIPSLAAYGAGGWPIDRYAMNLMSEWGVGYPEWNYGMLLLVSPGDRKARIELCIARVDAKRRTAERCDLRARSDDPQIRSRHARKEPRR